MAAAAWAAPASANSTATLSGDTTYAAIEARTGEYAGHPDVWGPGGAFMDPAFNRCTAEATLEMTDRNTAELRLVETCFGMERPADVFDVHLTPSGIVKMTPRSPADYAAGTAAATGCALNGPYPTYHGTFDGTHLSVSSEFHGLCDGGFFWGPFGGITTDNGPIHASFGIDLSTPAP
jgi:hypothetical protein